MRRDVCTTGSRRMPPRSSIVLVVVGFLLLIATATSAAPGPIVGGGCPSDMVEVAGEYCPVVEQRCIRFVDPEGVFQLRCAEFAPRVKCIGKTTTKPL